VVRQHLHDRRSVVHPLNPREPESRSAGKLITEKAFLSGLIPAGRARAQRSARGLSGASKRLARDRNTEPIAPRLECSLRIAHIHGRWLRALIDRGASPVFAPLSPVGIGLAIHASARSYSSYQYKAFEHQRDLFTHKVSLWRGEPL
jgi:hypothetical protein